MFDKSYVYIRKDVLQKILPLGLSLRKMGLKLNVAPKTVQKKLRFHKLIGETETLQDAYKRMGIKTDKKRKLDKTRTEILNYFKQCVSYLPLANHHIFSSYSTKMPSY